MSINEEGWEEPEPYGCIYCGLWEELYKWENDGPMCIHCINGAKKDDPL